MLVLEMKASSKIGTDLETILADVPKGERNGRPTKDQYLVKCPSYGIGYFTRMFCVSNKWWDLQPCNIEQTSDILSCNLSNNLKGIDKTRIRLLMQPLRWQKIIFGLSSSIISSNMVPRTFLTLTITKRSLCWTGSRHYQIPSAKITQYF